MWPPHPLTVPQRLNTVKGPTSTVMPQAGSWGPSREGPGALLAEGPGTWEIPKGPGCVLGPVSWGPRGSSPQGQWVSTKAESDAQIATPLLPCPLKEVTGHKASGWEPNTSPTLAPCCFPHHAYSTLPAGGCCLVFTPPGGLLGLFSPASPHKPHSDSIPSPVTLSLGGLEAPTPHEGWIRALLSSRRPAGGGR